MLSPIPTDCRYLVDNRQEGLPVPSLADWLLFTHLIRFDAVESILFKANIRRIQDYQHLRVRHCMDSPSCCPRVLCPWAWVQTSHPASKRFSVMPTTGLAGRPVRHTRRHRDTQVAAHHGGRVAIAAGPEPQAAHPARVF